MTCIKRQSKQGINHPIYRYLILMKISNQIKVRKELKKKGGKFCAYDKSICIGPQSRSSCLVSDWKLLFPLFPEFPSPSLFPLLLPVPLPLLLVSAGDPNVLLNGHGNGNEILNLRSIVLGVGGVSPELPV